MRTDEELVIASQGGDTESFGLLVRRHESVVRSVVIASSLSIDRVDDIVQETFVAAWQEIARLGSEKKFRAWICAIARNQSANAKRRGWREVPDADPTVGLSVDSAEDVLLEREVAVAIEEALASIPESSREAIVLFYYEDESITNVALGLGISEAAAQKRISRARIIVKDELRSSLNHGVLMKRTGAGLSAAVLGQICKIPQAGAAGVSQMGLLKGNVIMKLTPAFAMIFTLAIGLVFYLSPDSDHGAHASPPPDAAKSKEVSAAQTTVTTKPPQRSGIRRIGKSERSRRLAAHAATESKPPPQVQKTKSDREVISAAMKAIRPLMAECHDLASAYGPATSGIMKILIEISGESGIEGLVSEALIVGRSGSLNPPDDEFEECLRETILSVEFDVDRTIAVTYPFVFRASDKSVAKASLSRSDLESFVKSIDDARQLANLADEYAFTEPQIAINICDQVSSIAQGNEQMPLHTCTIVACKVGDEKRAVSFWLSLSDSFRGPKSLHWADQWCAKEGINLPAGNAQ